MAKESTLEEVERGCERAKALQQTEGCMTRRGEMNKEVSKMGKGGCLKVQTTSYKINMSWRCNVLHGDYS